VKVLVPASPDLIPETFHISPDGKRLAVSYEQSTRSLVIADGVQEVRTSTK